MKVRTLIAGGAVVVLCGGLGVCIAQEAPAPAPSVAPSHAPEATLATKPKHHRKHHQVKHHQVKHHAQKEFSEQELQQYLAAHPTPSQ